MPDSESAIFSEEELEFLRTQADEYGWYTCTDEAHDLIEGLCARRLMAANGDFKVVPLRRYHANLEGHVPPPTDMVLRHYELIGAGRIAFHTLQHPRVGLTAPSPSVLHSVHG